MNQALEMFAVDHQQLKVRRRSKYVYISEILKSERSKKGNHTKEIESWIEIPCRILVELPNASGGVGVRLK